MHTLLFGLELILQATLIAKLVALIEGLIIHACIQNSLGIKLQVGT